MNKHLKLTEQKAVYFNCESCEEEGIILFGEVVHGCPNCFRALSHGDVDVRGPFSVRKLGDD